MEGRGYNLFQGPSKPYTVTIWPLSIYSLCVYDALDEILEQFQVHILHNHTFLVFNVLYKNEKKIK